jgi:hypothetical protein
VTGLNPLAGIVVLSLLGLAVSWLTGRAETLQPARL